MRFTRINADKRRLKVDVKCFTAKTLLHNFASLACFAFRKLNIYFNSYIIDRLQPPTPEAISTLPPSHLDLLFRISTALLIMAQAQPIVLLRWRAYPCQILPNDPYKLGHMLPDIFDSFLLGISAYLLHLTMTSINEHL
jgi:hypothetical protein